MTRGSLTAVFAAVALAGCSGSDGSSGGHDGAASTSTSGTSVSESSTPSSSVTDRSSAADPSEPGTSSPDSDKTIASEQPAMFATPSGAIGCIVDGGYARCDILEPSWSVQPEDIDDSCEFDQGSSLAVDKDGAQMNCVSDTIVMGASVDGQYTQWWDESYGTVPATNRSGPNARLPYGYSLTVGELTCSSERAGVTCAHSGGGSFFLSKETYTLTD